MLAVRDVAEAEGLWFEVVRKEVARQIGPWKRLALSREAHIQKLNSIDVYHTQLNRAQLFVTTETG